jgi:tetratricopeptide (TPR) repeat protein
MSAEELYNELYAITKSDQSVFYISQIHLAQNDLGQAASALEGLASWSEYYPTAQVQLARLEWKNNQTDFAMNRLRRAHHLRPDSLELYQEYGQYMIWSKKYVEALALIEQGIRSYSKDDKLRLQAAYIHFKMGNMKSFKRQVEIAQKLNPTNSEIYAVLAELWYERKKPYTELEFLAQKAVDLNTKNKNIKPLLAWAMLQQDKLTEAVKLFEDFYDQNPNELFYAESLAEIYRRNVLATKKAEFSQKAAVLQADAKIQSELDYFRFQSQDERLKTDGNGNSRLPASLDDNR